MIALYKPYFFAQGEEAKLWLEIFDKHGAVELIEFLAGVNLLRTPCPEAAEPLNENLLHEAVGELTITYSFALSYIGVSKRCPVGDETNKITGDLI